MEIVRRKIEGIILSKMPFQDRHMICHLLGRNGRKTSVLFYGGQGGGIKKKSSNLDLGTMVWVELAPSRSTQSLLRAKEWDILWRHKKIREHYPIFAHLCFYLETVAKLSPEDNLFEEETPGHQNLFKVAANGIYSLEKNTTPQTKNLFFRSTLFLGKLLIAEGLFPEVSHCILTGKALRRNGGESVLLNDLGGLALREALGCGECPSDYPLSTHSSLGHFLQELAHEPYHLIGFRPSVDRDCFGLLFDYCLYQFHWSKKDLRTYPLLAV